MRILGSSVLAMEFFIIGFALLLAKDGHGALAIWLGVLLAISALLIAGMMKRKSGWILGSFLQIGLIAYGFVVTTMFFLGVLFAALWVIAYVVGREGEAIRARLLENPPD